MLPLARRITPLPWLLLLAVGATAVVAAISLIPGVPSAQRPGRLPLRGGIVLMFAAAYGVGRVAAYFPFPALPYTQWLRATPWTARRPLPLGDVHLTWRDLVAIGLLVLLGLGTAPWVVLAVPFIALLGYLVTMTVVLSTGGAALQAMLIWAILGLVMRLYLHDAGQPARLLALAAAYPIAWHGLRRVLAALPWREPLVRRPGAKQESVFEPAGAHPLRRYVKMVGWPMSELAPIPSEKPSPATHRIALPLVAGWWTAVAFSPLDQWSFEPVMMETERLFIFGAVALLATFRLAGYWMPYAAPISPLGRLAIGRLVIPGYDVIFIGPLLTAAVPVLITLAGIEAGVPMSIRAGVSAAAAMLIVQFCGPALGRWRLIGHHRPRLLPRGG